MGAIYRIYNTATRQSYIGQSDRPYYRISRHLTPDDSNASPAIQAALLNHPPKSWQWEIIADEKDYPRVSLNDLECLFIDLYGSRSHGYNIKPGGGAPPCGDTRDETRFRKGMRNKIVRAISAYQKEHKPGILPIDVLPLAEAPDSVLINLIDYLVEIENLEDLKDVIEKAKSLDELKKACEQLTDEIRELFMPAWDNICTDLRPYFFLQLSIQWDMKKAEDGEEVGSWSITPRVLTPFDYRSA